MQRRTLLLDGAIVVGTSLADDSGPDGTPDEPSTPLADTGNGSVHGNGRARATGQVGGNGSAHPGKWPPEPGTPAEDLVVPEDRPRLGRALRRARDEGELWFLFRDAPSEAQWLGHLAALSEGGPLERGDRQLLVWTWESVPPECHVLSRRQREILLEVLHGRTASQVARHLGISPNTVRTHLLRCQCAARCADHVSLLAWAHRHRRVLELLEV